MPLRWGPADAQDIVKNPASGSALQMTRESSSQLRLDVTYSSSQIAESS